MNDSLAPIKRGRGTDLLLAHCDALTRVEDIGPSALRRLEQELGADLARLLVVALAGRRRRRTELAA
jgi:hypothetical protein